MKLEILAQTGHEKVRRSVDRLPEVIGFNPFALVSDNSQLCLALAGEKVYRKSGSGIRKCNPGIGNLKKRKSWLKSRPVWRGTQFETTTCGSFSVHDLLG